MAANLLKENNDSLYGIQYEQFLLVRGEKEESILQDKKFFVLDNIEEPNIVPNLNINKIVDDQIYCHYYDNDNFIYHEVLRRDFNFIKYTIGFAGENEIVVFITAIYKK